MSDKQRRARRRSFCANNSLHHLQHRRISADGCRRQMSIIIFEQPAMSNEYLSVLSVNKQKRRVHHLFVRCFLCGISMCVKDGQNVICEIRVKAG